MPFGRGLVRRAAVAPAHLQRGLVLLAGDAERQRQRLALLELERRAAADRIAADDRADAPELAVQVRRCPTAGSNWPPVSLAMCARNSSSEAPTAYVNTGMPASWKHSVAPLKRPHVVVAVA